MLYNQRAVMVDIYANRRARLRQLIEERFDNNQSALARAIGHAPSYVNGIFRGRCSLVETSARQIEADLGLPDGWMDLKPPPGAVRKTPYEARRGQPPKVRSVRDLLDAGYTQRETAQQLEVHESTVSRAVQRERAAEKKHKPKRPQRVAA